jgi:hypothetical protein
MDPAIGFVLQQNLHDLLLTNFTCTIGHTNYIVTAKHELLLRLLREEESVAAAGSHVYDQFGLIGQTIH